jgi:hypothetical protein
MSTCSHALYLALTQDLSRWIPNSPNLFSPKNISKIEIDASGLTGKGYASLSLLKSIFKKFEDTSSSAADEAALSLFIRMNDKCKEYSFPDIWSLPEDLIQVFTWAKTYIDRFLFDGPDCLFDYRKWIEECDFGPGASVQASGASFLHKVGSSKLSCTDSSIYSMYIESIRGSRTWLEAEKLRRDAFGLPVIVSGSKLCFVPKSSEISRTICVEPSLNMFLQKGLGRWIETRLSQSFGFDLRDQQFRNKRLAQIGSKTGRFGTIDLSSASDTISLGICKYLFPESFLSWLEILRSKTTTLPSGEVVELHMLSSMGNAYTFPIQTLVFSALALGVYRVHGVDFIRPTSEHAGNLGVFGDDIVVESSCFNLLCRALEASGFLVNQSKSFNTGLFRESCGGDYFDGRNVRGVYCKTLRTTHSKYSLINRLNDWSANQGIPLHNAITLLLKDVRFNPVPPWESDIAGVKVPLCLANVKRNKNGSFVYKRLQARSISFDVSSQERWDYKAARKFRLTYNPSAILLSSTKGTLRNGSLNLRIDVVRPSYRFGIAPCWDFIDLEHSRLENVGFGAWKQVSLINFGSRL